jgi:hypothetical protein
VLAACTLGAQLWQHGMLQDRGDQRGATLLVPRGGQDVLLAVQWVLHLGQSPQHDAGILGREDVQVDNCSSNQMFDNTCRAWVVDKSQAIDGVSYTLPAPFASDACLLSQSRPTASPAASRSNHTAQVSSIVARFSVTRATSIGVTAGIPGHGSEHGHGTAAWASLPQPQQAAAWRAEPHNE